MAAARTTKIDAMTAGIYLLADPPDSAVVVLREASAWANSSADDGSESADSTVAGEDLEANLSGRH